MANNKDIAVLAKKVYELSVLPVEALEARKWEALLILNAVYSSATPEGIDRANADKVARWGAQIQQEGLLSRMHPKWHLRTDDGKPPAARHALESALSNPTRDLRARLATLQFLAPAERPPLGDLARALIADAYASAQGVARQQYLDTVARLKTRFTNPWPIVLASDGGLPPVMILIDNQGGALNDGGVLDDEPADDPLWANAVRTWDVDFLRDNPLAQLYLGVEAVAGDVVETAGQVAAGTHDAARGVATLLKRAPYVLAGIGAIGATALVIAAVNRAPRSLPTTP
jgi:hypothetical protein